MPGSVVQISVCSMECDITLVVVEGDPDQRAGVSVPSSRIIHTIIITTHQHQPNTPSQWDLQTICSCDLCPLLLFSRAVW